MARFLSKAAASRQHAATVFWLAALGVLFLAAFHQILLRTVKGWIGFEDSYGLLIMAISVFMMWDKKDQLAGTTPTPTILPGFAMVLTGAVTQLAAALSNTLMLQGFGLVISLLGLTWLILGWPFMRLLAVPIGYLAFMFSFFEELLGFFSGSLQGTTASMAGLFLKLLGIPVFLSGELIQMPHITLEVAKVCNGVNHIIALVALAIPLAVKMFSSVYRQVGLVVLAFFVGLFANALRVTLIGIWTIKYRQESIHGPFEVLYVSFILVVGLLLIGMVALLTRKTGEGKNARRALVRSSANHEAGILGRLKKTPIACGVAVFAALLGYQKLFAGQSVALSMPLRLFPDTIQDWHSNEVTDPQWPFKHLAGDRQLRRIYTKANDVVPIGLTIAYFDRQTQDKEVVNQRLMWLHLKADPVNIDLDGRRVRVIRGAARGIADQSYAGDRRIFYFFYYVNGKVLTDPYKVKYESLRSELFKGTSEAALVVFSTEGEGVPTRDNENEVLTFMTAAMPVLIEQISNGRLRIGAVRQRSVW